MSPYQLTAAVDSAQRGVWAMGYFAFFEPCHLFRQETTSNPQNSYFNNHIFYTTNNFHFL
jgi:hypothetical protein